MTDLLHKDLTFAIIGDYEADLVTDKKLIVELKLFRNLIPAIEPRQCIILRQQAYALSSC